MGFGDDVERWAVSAEKKVELATRKLALEIFSRVINRTPVDTGRARGNWQVSIGRIPTDIVDRLDETGSKAIADVQKVAESLTLGETIYLINNLPYIRRLEYGWSKQAPQGMVRITVREFREVVKQIAQQISQGR